jgi:hypothetical protein
LSDDIDNLLQTRKAPAQASYVSCGLDNDPAVVGYPFQFFPDIGWLEAEDFPNIVANDAVIADAGSMEPVCEK